MVQNKKKESATPPERKELTLLQKKRRHELAVKMGWKLDPIPGPTVIAAPVASEPENPVDAVVMTPANPCLSLYRELRAGQLSLDDFLDAIDAYCLSTQEIFLEYEYKQKPSKPEALEKAEYAFREKNDPSEWDAGTQKIMEKLAAAKPEVETYRRALGKWENNNRSNLGWLREMLSRQASKNPVYAARIREALYTHNEAA